MMILMMMMMMMMKLLMMKCRWRGKVAAAAAAAAASDDDDDNDKFGLLCKMCDIYGQAFTTKLHKRIWHIKTVVMNSAEYVPHVWHIRSVSHTVRQSYGTPVQPWDSPEVNHIYTVTNHNHKRLQNYYYGLFRPHVLTCIERQCEWIISSNRMTFLLEINKEISYFSFLRKYLLFYENIT